MNHNTHYHIFYSFLLLFQMGKMYAFKYRLYISVCLTLQFLYPTTIIICLAERSVLLTVFTLIYLTSLYFVCRFLLFNFHTNKGKCILLNFFLLLAFRDRVHIYTITLLFKLMDSLAKLLGFNIAW